ncbi:MAG: DUF2207 domain-containing protein [Candidatus Dojkabacteria bacterium]|nr:MAG: DUF2207 domain-containing protein [Candidatus Dojkabacteria bacterium]
MKSKLILFYIAVMFGIFLSLFIISPVAAQSSPLGFAPAREAIETWESIIDVQKNGDLIVTEKITVTAKNININHGIYRDFPTAYPHGFGFKSLRGFSILNIKKDGKNEPYSTETLTNGQRIYIGDEDIVIPPGRYVYEITYKTTRQIGFFPEYDELYYNITGNDWKFPINEAKATILLPEETTIASVMVKGFTGISGSNEQAVRFHKTQQNGRPAVVIEATRSLDQLEGMTAVVTFPKGIIPEPTTIQGTLRFIFDNISAFGGVVLTLVLTVFYFGLWWLFGRDKGIRVAVPQYKPVDGISPGASRYLTQMGYDSKALTATIIGLAVKGYIKIIEVTDSEAFEVERAGDLPAKDYDVTTKISVKGVPFFSEEKFAVEKLTTGVASLTDDEQVLYAMMFPGDTKTLLFSSAYYKKIEEMTNQFKHSLGRQFDGTYFTRGIQYFVLGLLISGLYGLIILIDMARAGGGDAYGLLLFAIIWNGVVVTIIRGAFTAQMPTLQRLLSSAFLIPFACVGLFTLFFSSIYISVFGVMSLFIQLILHSVFFSAIKARTAKGSEAQNALDGLKRYMTLAEEERIKFFNKELPKDIKTYEKLLPFAIAFDVETAWTKEFHDIIENARASGYEPNWYAGHNIAYFSSNFGQSFSNSLSSSVAAASVNPTSSSGYGGGSSGGGGGGGGGGGW